MANERKAYDLLQWTKFGCYGHRINLMVKHALGIPELSKIVAKGRKLVAYFHQSPSVNDLLMAKQELLLSDELRGHKLMDCPTRSNSTYAMLERLLEQTPTIKAVISRPECNKAAALTLKNYVYSFVSVCFVALRPKSTAMVMAGPSVHLTTLFPGQA